MLTVPLPFDSFLIDVLDIIKLPAEHEPPTHQRGSSCLGSSRISRPRYMILQTLSEIMYSFHSDIDLALLFLLFTCT
jgi:hypothetical protein